EMEQLKTFHYKKNELSSNIDNNERIEQHSCVICLESFNEGDSIRELKVCTHIFHKDCIDEWFSSKFNLNKRSCPLCSCDALNSR
ncbi:hypothetical protein HK099_003488, partial [Clydaea vesicula]